MKKRALLAVGREQQLGTFTCTQIIGTATTANIVESKDQIHFRTLQAIPKIPNLTKELGITHTILIGLKATTATELVRSINNKGNKGIKHLIVLTEGEKLPVFTEADNATVYATLEELEKENFSLKEVTAEAIAG